MSRPDLCGALSGRRSSHRLPQAENHKRDQDQKRCHHLCLDVLLCNGRFGNADRFNLHGFVSLDNIIAEHLLLHRVHPLGSDWSTSGGAERGQGGQIKAESVPHRCVDPGSAGAEVRLGSALDRAGYVRRGRFVFNDNMCVSVQHAQHSGFTSSVSSESGEVDVLQDKQSVTFYLFIQNRNFTF